MLDLSVSGGCHGPQRPLPQEYLVKEWKKTGGEARQELLGDLKRWSDAAGRGADELGKWRKALHLKVLTALHLPADNPRYRWLLEAYNQERELYKQKVAKLR